MSQTENNALTHILQLADGYGSTRLCRLLKTEGAISTIRIKDNAYWEPTRWTTRVVSTSRLQEIPTN